MSEKIKVSTLKWCALEVCLKFFVRFCKDVYLKATTNKLCNDSPRRKHFLLTQNHFILAEFMTFTMVVFLNFPPTDDIDFRCFMRVVPLHLAQANVAIMHKLYCRAYIINLEQTVIETL